MSNPQGEHPTTTTPVAPEGHDSSPAEEKSFTQSDVGRLLAAERKRVRELVLEESRQAAAQKPTPPPAPKSEADLSKTDLLAKIEDLELGRSFDLAIAGRQVSAAQRSVLERLYRVERPQDGGAWLSQQLDALGLAQPQTQPQTETNSPRRPPVSDAGGPSTQPDPDRTDNVLLWDDGRIERLIEEKGAIDGRRAIREKLMRQLRGVQFELPKRR